MISDAGGLGIRIAEVCVISDGVGFGIRIAEVCVISDDAGFGAGRGTPRGGVLVGFTATDSAID